MTRKQRHSAYEGVALILAGTLGAFVIPTLISAHDTVSLFAGLTLILGWATWTAFYIYRLNTKG